ncbi:hypothetical protein KQH56_01620 [bacterium]|nr:hypothetical protein [bacterium]
MASSIWPYDYYQDLHFIDKKDPMELVVFLASPFKPTEIYQDLQEFCQLACNQLAAQIGVKISCQRGDTPSTPEIIHQDIWNYLQNSDTLIFDISEGNQNVMIELGVASTLRDKNQLIIIKDKESEVKQIFDISPARYLVYDRKKIFDHQFFEKLVTALQFALTPAPFTPYKFEDIKLPISIESNYPESFSTLLSPPNLHRRITNDGLEFGSLNFYQYSWLTLGNKNISNIHIKTLMKFVDINSNLPEGEGWIGLSLRSQHFYANFNHLFYVKPNGMVIYARPLDDTGNYEDLTLGIITSFDTKRWITFNLKFDDKSLNVSIENISRIFSIDNPEDMPFCFHSGLIRFHTYKARACIKSIEANYPSENSNIE